MLIEEAAIPFLFVHIPKTGGTSVETALLPAVLGRDLERLGADERNRCALPGGGEGIQHWKLSNYINQRDIALEGLFKFAFVRNPWDLVVSEIRYFQRRGHEFFDAPTLKGNIGRLVMFNEPHLWGHDFSPQIGYLTRPDGEAAMDYIGYFEHLEEHFGQVCAKLGLDAIRLPHVFDSGDRRHYSEFYDHETRAWVEERFWADIDAFGYRFEEGAPSVPTRFLPLERGALGLPEPVGGAAEPAEPGGERSTAGTGERDEVAASNHLAVCFCMEGGKIEAQGLALARSLVENGALEEGSPVFAVQPRGETTLCAESHEVLDRLGVVYIRADANRSWWRYPYANKIYASALVEELVEGKIGTLLFLDSDTLVNRPLSGLLLGGDELAAAKPVDKSNIAVPVGGELNAFWQALLREADVPEEDYLAETVRSTVDGEEIHPYFNSGVVAVRPGIGIWRHARELLEHSEILRAMFPRISGPWRNYFEQALVSAVLMAGAGFRQIRELASSFNYPYHLHNELKHTASLGLEEVTLIHHHGRLREIPNEAEWGS